MFERTGGRFEAVWAQGWGGETDVCEGVDVVVGVVEGGAPGAVGEVEEREGGVVFGG